MSAAPWSSADGVGCMLHAGVRVVDSPGGGVGHSFAARGGMECCDGLRWARSIRGGDHAVCVGGHDCYDPRPPRSVSAHAAGTGADVDRLRMWWSRSP